MAVTSSNSSLLTSDDNNENQLTISKVVDEHNVPIINRITYQTSFKASGINAERNSSVWIWSGNTKLGEATSNGAGEWETKLLDAPYFDCYSAFAEGQWADKPVSPPRRFTVATDTPIINAVLVDGEPIKDEDTISATEVTLDVNAIPNQDARAFNGATLLKTEPANACGKCKIVLTDLPPGTYSITIKAPNDKESTPFRFTVVEEGIKPVTLDKLTDTDGNEIPPDTTTPKNSLLALGKAEPGEEVELFDGGDSLGTVFADATTGEYSLPTGTLTNGPHTFTVVGKYTGGGTSESITVTVKVNKPVTFDKLTDTDGNEIPPDTTTPKNSLLAVGKAEPGEEVELFDGGDSLGTVFADATTGEYSLPTGQLTNGLHTFTVVGKYTGGGTSESITVTVEAATTAPTNTRIYDVDGNVIADGGDINEIWLIARGLYTPNSEVKIKVNGVIQTDPETTNEQGKWVFFLPGLVVGVTYEISALTLDEMGESNKWSVIARTPS